MNCLRLVKSRMHFCRKCPFSLSLFFPVEKNCNLSVEKWVSLIFCQRNLRKYKFASACIRFLHSVKSLVKSVGPQGQLTSDIFNTFKSALCCSYYQHKFFIILIMFQCALPIILYIAILYNLTFQLNFIYRCVAIR